MALQDLFGIGKGYSQVWQGNKGLEMLAQQDFAARKKKQQDDAELQAEVAKINYDGAKNEDVPHLIDSYSNIKKKYAEYRQATNPKDRIKLYTEIQDEKANFGQRLALSKQNVQLDGEYGKLAITKSDEIADDYHDKFKRFKSLSSFDPERIKLGEDLLKNGLKPKFDEDKYFNEKSKMYVEKVEAGTPRIVKSPFGQQSVVYDGEKFNAQGFANQVLNDLKNDRGMRATVAKMYPPTDDPKEIAKNQIDYANRLANLGAKQHVVTDKVTGSRNDPSWIEIERLRLAQLAAVNKGKEKEDESTYRQKVIEGIVNNDKKSIDEMKAYLPSGSQVQYTTSKPTKYSKGGYNLVRVTIPDYRDNKGERRKGFTEDISLSKGDAMNRLNAILNDYTGEKISPSKVNIEGGKPRGAKIEIKGNPISGKPKKDNPLGLDL